MCDWFSVKIWMELVALLGNAMSKQQVRIVDLGRGPQIEGHRITVMDVFYLHPSRL
jgi:hypothetical protein